MSNIICSLSSWTFQYVAYWRSHSLHKWYSHYCRSLPVTTCFFKSSTKEDFCYLNFILISLSLSLPLCSGVYESDILAQRRGDTANRFPSHPDLWGVGAAIWRKLRPAGLLDEEGLCKQRGSWGRGSRGTVILTVMTLFRVIVCYLQVTAQCVRLSSEEQYRRFGVFVLHLNETKY